MSVDAVKINEPAQNVNTNNSATSSVSEANTDAQEVQTSSAVQEENLFKDDATSTIGDDFAAKNAEKTESCSDNNAEKIEKVESKTVSKLGKIWGKIVELFTKDTKDGKIGPTRQILTGDCWILSGVNSMSYSEKGREMIKDALEYTDNGTIVHLKGAKDYFVSNDEITKTKGSLQFSGGDDDMIAFELAIEKVRDEQANNNMNFDEYNSAIESAIRLSSSSLEKSSIGDGGMVTEALYYITGKTGEKGTSEEKKQELLEKYINGNGDYILSCGTPDDNYSVTVKDANGKKVSLYGDHAYAVKSADENTVTVVNPWNSGKEIVLSKDTFLNRFDCLYGLDLSENNPVEKKLFDTTKETSTDFNGNKTETIKNHNGEIISEKIYKPNGSMVKMTEYSDNSKSERNYHENGELKELDYNGTYYSEYSNSSFSYVEHSSYNKKGNFAHCLIIYHISEHF